VSSSKQLLYHGKYPIHRFPSGPLTSLFFDFYLSFFPTSICFAKHVQEKAARWAKSKRPRKSRPSDINRKPIVYQIHSMIKPAEYSISDAPAAPMPKLAKVE
jgi:Family of unknown function (DUF5323)